MTPQEKQDQSQKEMDALLESIGKQVSVSLIKDGKPRTYAGELLSVKPYAFIQMSQTPGESYIPFIGTNIAVTKIEESESKIILFQNDTKFPEEEWSRSDMNRFREEKWGTAKYNPIII